MPAAPSGRCNGARSRAPRFVDRARPGGRARRRRRRLRRRPCRTARSRRPPLRAHSTPRATRVAVGRPIQVNPSPFPLRPRPEEPWTPKWTIAACARKSGMSGWLATRKGPATRAFRSGSDGTRARDLRRDRTVQGSRGERRRSRDRNMHARGCLRGERIRVSERSGFGGLLPVCCPRRRLMR